MRQPVRVCFAWAALLCACRPYSADLLPPPHSSKPAKQSTGTQIADTGTPKADAGDAAVVDGGLPVSGTGGKGGGTAGTTSLGMAGSSGGPTECVTNPDSQNTSCTMICPESCNGKDDDCDGMIDEDLENACTLDNATGACVNGRCAIVQCQNGYRDCDHDPTTGCEVAATDVNNCGTCGNRCSFSHGLASCSAGKCVKTGCDALYADCDSNASDCETLTNTAQNCMACGKTCSDGDVANATASCDTGVCGVGMCLSGYGDCNAVPTDGCEQQLATTTHCGACNVPCDFMGATSDCATGVCLATACAPGYDDCDGNPANGCDSLAQASHCGACDKRCDTSLSNVTTADCSSAGCTLQCATGYADCDNDPSTGCETQISSLQRCGACDTPCALPHAEVSCDTGVCSFVRCSPGWGDCNSDPVTDGCETSLAQNDHCGACGTSCVGTVKPVCSGGSCSTLSCPANTADCNHDGMTCEAQLQTDIANCGACANACSFTAGSPHAAAGLTCSSGQCHATCDALYGDCNGDYRDGCETPLDTLTSCGGCGVGCSIANATPTCSGGSCHVSQCASDWKDCDSDGKSCETQLGTTQNCTGCGMACMLTNAVPSCTGTAGSHSCAISSCTQSYFADCNTTPGDGCEIDKRTDAKNCGACGNNCTTQPHVTAASTCSSGACNYTCASGFGNCNSMAGCETPLTTNTDCGTCGTSCARTNGTSSCATGTCTLTGCNTGYSDCDGNPADGCEPLTSLTNCGSCGMACSIVNGTATCATQSCSVATCNSGWGDCDASAANGCERNINPPAMGGLGPCLPDSGCVHQTYNSQDYYFCPTARTWSDARTHCQQQLLGELVHVTDVNENNFVKSHLTGDTWLGGTDSVAEGVWRWVDDNSQFFMGTGSSGTVLTYANWKSGEPNNSSSNENCLETYSDGTWNDQACTDTRAFICEIQLDLCPMDPNKINPGQCGCGTPDTDTDGDGTADCHDGCPSDKNKTAPGVCGCGTPDVDSDMDGVLDCNDACPNDPNKTASGVCGCGKPDVDTDGDGALDCNDACPLDPTRTTAPCGYDYTPLNFDPSAINFGTSPSTTLDCQSTTTIDTTPPVTITNWCGTLPTPLVQSQSQNGGPDVVVLPLQALTIASTTTLRVIGSRPLILAVRGNVAINGTINARGTGTTPGAGGNLCTGGNGGNGASDSNNNEGAGGGGGAGFAAVGGGGGKGDRTNGSTAGGSAGATEPGASLSPLRGGCKGGSGGNGSGTGGAGGGGGGVFQISAGGTVSVPSGAVLTASAGGGRAGSAKRDGGGGGGSGGAVLLEAHVVTVSSGAWITANGGGGASGSANSNGSATAGSDGSINGNSQAAGPSGNNGAGDGGKGGASSGGVTAGSDGACDGILCPFLGTDGAGGGGGGGAVGRIRVHGTQSCSLSGSFSPAVGQTNCP